MGRALGFIFVVVLLGTPALPQSKAIPPDPWGEPVEGIQVGLTVAPNLSSPRVPAFQVRLRNRGTLPVNFVAEALSARPDLEIDGVWYRKAGAGSCCTSPQSVAPGSDSQSLPLAIDNGLLFAINASGASANQQLTLTPGRHSIRVRTYSNDRIHVSVQSATPHTITLVSNVVEFEVLASPAPGK